MLQSAVMQKQRCNVFGFEVSIINFFPKKSVCIYCIIYYNCFGLVIDVAMLTTTSNSYTMGQVIVILWVVRLYVEIIQVL